MSAAILVTGGAGYIGSHVCERLSQEGYQPVVVDNLSRGHGDFVQFGPLAKYSILETPRLIRTIKEYKIESVVHLAAYAYVEESVKHPDLYYQNNVMGTLNLLKACQESGIKNFVFSSSCAVYGNPQKLPLKEDHSLLPINPYGHTKMICEKMLADFCATYPMKFLSLRYFNVAGASKSGKIGETHEPETHLLPHLLRAALSGEKVSVYGQDYPTPDGTCIRDFIHVEDLAMAHLLALRYLEKGLESNQPINLGGGKGYSVLEIINAVRETLGKTLSYENRPRRQGDPVQLFADISKARTLLGFHPEKNLRDMIESANRWMNSQP